MKLSKLAVVLLGVPAVLGTNEMRRVYRRQATGGLLPVPQSPTGSSTSTTPTSTSTSTTPTSTSTSTTTSPTSTSTTSQSSSSSSSSSSSKSTSQTTKTTLVTTTGDDGQPITLTVTTTNAVTPSPTQTDDTSNQPAAPSNSKSTIIGLSVAGGVALLGVIAFIVWKMKQKRFSQFDDEDPGAIKWPEASTDVNRSTAAAEAGVAARPAAADPYGTHATNSTVELDPYQVPPLPQGGYRDDPNIQAGGYYDPYRGPVPGTFASPPQSHDGHGAAPWGAQGGEAIPMSVRRGTPGPPGPPGPGGYDDYRRGSPAPYGGGAPSIRRGPSPGPNFAPDYGRGSPAPPPPNFNRPPANVAYDDPYGGTA